MGATGSVITAPSGPEANGATKVPGATSIKGQNLISQHKNTELPGTAPGKDSTNFRKTLVATVCPPGNINDSSTFLVTISGISKSVLNLSTLPSLEVLLRISYESLDILEQNTGKPYIQFPFQVILCWGSSSTIFQFKVFPSALDPSTIEREAVCLFVQTSQGKQIESLIMNAVKGLMSDMEKTAITSADFNTLKELIFDDQKSLSVSGLLIIFTIMFSPVNFLTTVYPHIF